MQAPPRIISGTALTLSVPSPEVQSLWLQPLESLLHLELYTLHCSSLQRCAFVPHKYSGCLLFTIVQVENKPSSQMHYYAPVNVMPIPPPPPWRGWEIPRGWCKLQHIDAPGRGVFSQVSSPGLKQDILLIQAVCVCFQQKLCSWWWGILLFGDTQFLPPHISLQLVGVTLTGALHISLHDSICHLVNVSELYACISACFHAVSVTLVFNCYRTLDRLDKSSVPPPKKKKIGVYILSDSVLYRELYNIFGEQDGAKMIQI